LSSLFCLLLPATCSRRHRKMAAESFPIRPAERGSSLGTMSDSNTQSLREEFNRWAEAGRGTDMEKEHLPVTLPVLEKMHLAPTDNILDVGSGSGWLSRRLAKLVPEGRVVGMDVSDEMIRVARRVSLEHENLLFITGEVTQIPWESNFFAHAISVESSYY